NNEGNCFRGSFFKRFIKKLAFKNARPYPKNCINTAFMERKPMYRLLFFSEESTSITVKYIISGVMAQKLKTSESTIESNTKNTKNVGNQNVNLDAEGCQLFKIGLTDPNFLTCK